MVLAICMSGSKSEIIRNLEKATRAPVGGWSANKKMTMRSDEFRIPRDSIKAA
jgi:hypothetical protein